MKISQAWNNTEYSMIGERLCEKYKKICKSKSKSKQHVKDRICLLPVWFEALGTSNSRRFC